MTNSNTASRRGRPPKAGRQNQDTRAALIRSGLAQLTENGFASSGIDAILKDVGVPKGSFYFYFKNKEAFGSAVIESYAQYFARKLDTYLLDEAYSPLTRLANFVEDAKAGMAKHAFKRGCLVGNLGQEVGVLPASFRPQLIEIFASWESRVCACFEQAKLVGEIAQDADCNALANYFWIGWEGAVIRAKLEQSAKPLEAYINHFICMLPK